MKRILVHLCILAAAVPAAAEAQSAEAGAPIVRVTPKDGKVTAPVDVEVLPAGQPGAGVRRVRIVVRPRVDAASLTIEVAAEDGLALTAPATWTAAAGAGEEVVHEVEVAASGNGEQRLVVTATVKDAGGTTQSGHHVFALNPAGAALTRSFRRPAATDPGGRVIIEVPASRP